MTEQDVLKFVDKIDRFEEDANYMNVYFKPKSGDDIKGLTQSFVDLGITNVVSSKNSVVNGTSIAEIKFVLGYRYSKQEKNIDDLMKKHARIKAWEVLRNNGGTNMNVAEAAFFATKGYKVAKAKSPTRAQI